MSLKVVHFFFSIVPDEQTRVELLLFILNSVVLRGTLSETGLPNFCNLWLWLKVNST